MPKAAPKHCPPITPASRRTTTKTHSNWQALLELQVSSTPALHRWPIFFNLLSILDAQARSIWLRYRLGQQTRYQISCGKLLVVEMTNINSRRWICSFCKTISFHISTRPKPDCNEFANVWPNVKKKRCGLFLKLYYILFSNSFLARPLCTVPFVLSSFGMCEYKIVKSSLVGIQTICNTDYASYTIVSFISFSFNLWPCSSWVLFYFCYDRWHLLDILCYETERTLTTVLHKLP